MLISSSVCFTQANSSSVGNWCFQWYKYQTCLGTEMTLTLPFLEDFLSVLWETGIGISRLLVFIIHFRFVIPSGCVPDVYPIVVTLYDDENCWHILVQTNLNLTELRQVSIRAGKAETEKAIHLQIFMKKNLCPIMSAYGSLSYQILLMKINS